MTSSFVPSSPGGSLRQGRQPDGPPLADLPIGNTFESCPDTPIGSLRQGGRNVISTSFAEGRGAGRAAEYVYPVPTNITAFGDPGIAGLARYGYVDTQQTGFAQNPGSAQAAYYRGRVCYKYSAPTGMIGGTGPSLPFAALKGGVAQRGDYQCWRVKLILAAEPNGLGDIGLGIVRGSDTHVNDGGNVQGMYLQPLPDNTIKFVARPVAFGPITVSEVCPISLFVADYHCYEFRIIGATLDTDAQLRILVDNQEQFRFSFGDGLLPNADLQAQIASIGGGTMYVPIGGLLVASAYDEASLL